MTRYDAMLHLEAGFLVSFQPCGKLFNLLFLFIIFLFVLVSEKKIQKSLNKINFSFKLLEKQ